MDLRASSSNPIYPWLHHVKELFEKYLNLIAKDYNDPQLIKLQNELWEFGCYIAMPLAEWKRTKIDSRLRFTTYFINIYLLCEDGLMITSKEGVEMKISFVDEVLELKNRLRYIFEWQQRALLHPTSSGITEGLLKKEVALVRKKLKEWGFIACVDIEPFVVGRGIDVIKIRVELKLHTFATPETIKIFDEIQMKEWGMREMTPTEKAAFQLLS